MQWRNTIQRENDSKPKGFSPPTQQAQVGDAVFWFNEDNTTEHQPYPAGPAGKPGDWGPPVPAQNSSQQLNLNKAGTYFYQCAAHQDETGEIIVANAVVIGPSGTGAATVAPAMLAIVAGQCVSWGNSDANDHQPTPDQGTPWFTKPIPSGDISAPITFTSVGNLPYHCALHKDAKEERGTIIVPNAVVIEPSGPGAAAIAPASLPIVAGQYVWWTNSDTHAHQPTPDQGDPWFKKPIPGGAISAPIQFASVGIVPYHCALHAAEKGIITITKS